MHRRSMRHSHHPSGIVVVAGERVNNCGLVVAPVGAVHIQNQGIGPAGAARCKAAGSLDDRKELRADHTVVGHIVVGRTVADHMAAAGGTAAASRSSSAC